jgi:IMP dehydrogenase/GMP reductase
MYHLAPRLGGRSEVLKAPIMELLGQMLLHKEEEEAKREKEAYDRYMNYQCMRNSHPTQDEKQAKAQDDFAKSLLPNGNKVGKKAMPTTDYNKLSKYRATQKS